MKPVNEANFDFDFDFELDSIDNSFTSASLSTATCDSLEEIISVESVERWTCNTNSPGRRSWSPLSTVSADATTDFTCFPELGVMPTVSSDVSSGLGMTFAEDDLITKPSSQRPGPRRRSTMQSTHSYRTSPYFIDRARSHSISTAPLSLTDPQDCSPLLDCGDFMLPDGDFASQHATTESTLMMNQMFSPHSDGVDTYLNPERFVTPRSQYSCDDLLLSSAFEEPVFPDTMSAVSSSSTGRFELPNQHGPCGDDGGHHHDDRAQKPDLFGPLAEDQLQPPAADMKPENPDLEPRIQELRFPGDLYTPKYVRGHGNKREGWCGICKPGRWLVLKNSAFWYDKSFTHGISAATGKAFDESTDTRRMQGNPDVWEGLCGSCGEWVALISSKKKGTTWFRHAYKVGCVSRLCFPPLLIIHSVIPTKRPRMR